MRTPKVHSEAGELFWMGVWGSSSAHLRYPTQEKVADRKDSRQRVSDPAELRARLRQPFAGSPGTAGANLRKTVRYARENCDPLHASAGMRNVLPRKWRVQGDNLDA